MGTLSEKLLYLNETKDWLEQYLRNNNFTFSDDLSLREKIQLLNNKKQIITTNLVFNLVLIGGKVIDTISGEDYSDKCDIFEDRFSIITDNIFTIETEEYSLFGFSPYTSEYLNSAAVGFQNAWIQSAYYPYFNIGGTDSKYNTRITGDIRINVNSKQYTLNQSALSTGNFMYLGVCLKSGEKAKTIINNTITENELTTTFTSFTVRKSTQIGNYNNTCYYKQLSLYNKYLTNEEIKQNISFYGIDYNKAYGFYDGIEGLGPMLPAIQSSPSDYLTFENSSNISQGVHSEHNKTYIIEPVSLKETEENYDNFEKVYFYSFPEQLYLGREESVSAFPYPNDITKKFEIEYSSSNPDICKCVGGLLIPLKIGEVNINATIRNTNIFTTKTVKIVNPPTIEEKIFYISNPVQEKNAKETMQWMQDTINKAHLEGYNICKFPKESIYHIVPIVQSWELPTQMILDFNNSTVFIDDEHEFTTQNYHLFNMDEGQEFSGIKNLILYGERYNDPSKVGQNIYTEGNCWISMGYCKWCILENIYTRYTCGFDICIGGYSRFRNDPNYTTHGPIDYTNFQKGKILSNGTVEERDDWITTNKKLPVIDRSYTDGNFLMGTYTAGIGVIGARLYNICWYDNELNPVDYYEGCCQNEPYPLKENFAYYDITFNTSILPDRNNTGGDDYCAIRMLQARGTNYLTIKNFISLDNYSGAFSVVGQTNHLLVNNLFTWSWEKRKNNWDIDFEDGWLNMRTYVLKNIYANLVYFSGDGGTLINSAVKNLNIRDDMQSFKLLNDYIPNLTIATGKFCNIIIGVITDKDLNSLSSTYGTFVIGNEKEKIQRNKIDLKNYNILFQ